VSRQNCYGDYKPPVYEWKNDEYVSVVNYRGVNVGTPRGLWICDDIHKPSYCAYCRGEYIKGEYGDYCSMCYGPREDTDVYLCFKNNSNIKRYYIGIDWAI